MCVWAHTRKINGAVCAYMCGFCTILLYFVGHAYFFLKITFLVVAEVFGHVIELRTCMKP